MSTAVVSLTSPPVGRTAPIAAGDVSLNVWEAGRAGPPTLLIHGLPSNHCLWWDVVPRLTPHARVIAPDLLGYGLSDRPDGHAVDLRSQANHLVSLLDTLGLDRVTLVGHDIGGGIAQLLAVGHPDRIERLCLVNAVCYDAWPVPAVKMLQLGAPVLEHLPSTPTVAGLRAGLRTLFANHAQAERYIDAFVAPFDSREGIDAFVAHLRALDVRDTAALAPRLRSLSTPTAVVWGREDHQLPPKLAQRLGSDIPGATVELIEGANHFAPADRPEQVAGAILNLLARAPAGA